VPWTKGQHVAAAFEEIGLGNWKFDVDPEQQQSALRRLEAMMASWNGQGIRIGYALATPANTDWDQDSGVPEEANLAIFTNLAILIAPTVGKTVKAETVKTANAGYRALLSKVAAAALQEQSYPKTFPRGAGNRRSNDRRPFFPGPEEDTLAAGPDKELDFK
jgi:hypothetical protein